jgi:acyl carrier protein
MLSIHSQNDLEIIATMAFKADDVLKTEREKIRRRASLLKAALLDSLNHIEVVLTLEDKESLKLLRSRIIATGDERVMLDKGFTIPVQCIRQVDFP